MSGLNATPAEVWITGIGLVSSLGEGAEVHAGLLGATAPAPVLTEAFAPHPVHPLSAVKFEAQLPPRDIRQMELWQRLGTYTAGLAIDAAGARPLVSAMDLVVAAGLGEGSVPLNEALHAELLALPAGGQEAEALVNQRLSSGLRPTLFLAQLPNLLAGNITIVHGVTASSRTLMGEELAAADAVRVAHRRIAEGRSRIALTGGAFNAERADLLLNIGFGGGLWQGAWQPIEARQAAGGGLCLGSLAAFLVLEEAGHARARGATPLARLRGVATASVNRDAGGDTAASLASVAGALGPLREAGVASAATGVGALFAAEMAGLDEAQVSGPRRFPGSQLGHAPEASFPAAIAAAALALQAGEGPGQWLVTGVGQLRGEAAALLEAVA